MMLLYDIKRNESYVSIKCKVRDREGWREWMTRCCGQNTSLMMKKPEETTNKVLAVGNKQRHSFKL